MSQASETHIEVCQEAEYEAPDWSEYEAYEAEIAFKERSRKAAEDG